MRHTTTLLLLALCTLVHGQFSAIGADHEAVKGLLAATRAMGKSFAGADFELEFERLGQGLRPSRRLLPQEHILPPGQDRQAEPITVDGDRRFLQQPRIVP